MKKYVYADNAATTKLDPEAFEEMLTYLSKEYSNPSQPYSFSREAKAAITQARETISGCINASPDEIYFTSGGTESDNWAIKRVIPTKTKTTVVTSPIEHHAVLNSCAALKNEGRRIICLPVDKTGRVSAQRAHEIIRDDAYLISVMYSNNEIGTKEPIKELATMAHEAGAMFHTDAVQAVGHVPIDVQDLGVDMLSASAHKFNGPKGIGFLHIKRGTQIAPLLDGGSQETGMRAGTENVASIVGMAIALKNNVAKMDEHMKRVLRLEEALISALDEKGLDYIRNGSAEHIPGNISLSFRGAEGEMLLHRLDLMGIAISTGSACDSKITQVSHVIKAIRVPKEYAKGTIRISLSADNTEEEVVYIAESIAKIINSPE